MKNSKNISDSDMAGLFDTLANKYDLLNRTLSLGLDLLWRRKAAKTVRTLGPRKLLDVAVGSGDLLISCLKHNPDLAEAVGVDLSEEMLKIADRKIKKNGEKLCEKTQLLQASASCLPFDNDSFDCVTIGFGIRNFSNKQDGLAEIKRVLKPGGTLVILEFALPKSLVVRKLYLLYLRHLVPLAGGILAGNRGAYKYLNDSIEDFGPAEKLCQILSDAGFTEIKTTPLTLSIACIYVAKKTTGTGSTASGQ